MCATLLGVLIVSLLLPVAGWSAAQEEIGVSVSVNRDTIGLDEQVVLSVRVVGSQRNLPAPQIPTLTTFEVYSQGQSSNISISNGKVNSSVTYRYLLLPKKVGTFPIDQIGVVFNRRRYKGNKVEITVLSKSVSAPRTLQNNARGATGSSSSYFLLAVVDNDNPYVNEQVTLTLKFFIAVQYYGTPELTEPTTTGFWTEVLGNKTPYYQKVNNRTYKVIERKYALFPTQTGKLEIGRSAIKTTIAARRRNFKDPFDVFGDFFGRGQEVTARSKPVAVNVKPLPKKGRPDDFSGTIGEFSISATADKTQAEVNQPISVTIRIAGTGNIKSVAEPIMPNLPDFRVYKESSREKISKVGDRIGGAKIFNEVFIPKLPGIFEIPAISFNFFDPRAGKYREVSTNPISLKILKPEGYVASSEVPFVSPSITIGREARDIRFIKTEPGDMSPVGRILLFTPLYLIVNGLPIALLAGMMLVRRQRRKAAADVGWARSRSAVRQARKRLAKARSLAAAATVTDFYAEISSALLSYVADKFNLSPHGLTSDSIARLLLAQKVSDELVGELKELIHQADFARYAQGSLTDADIQKDLQRAEKVITSIEGLQF